MSTLLNRSKGVASNKLRALRNAFQNVNIVPYEQVMKNARIEKVESQAHDDELLKDQIIFIDKEIKNFNMKEVQELVKLDTEYSNVKFKLLTNNAELNESRINTNFKRLLNNGLYYGIYMNSPQQIKRNLETLKKEEGSKVERVFKQAYMAESTNSARSTTKFVEFPNHQTFKVPIEIEGVTYQLETPSLSILTLTQGIGIPSNHPDKEKLLALKETSNIFMGQGHITFYELQEEDSTTESLIPLIPKHIEAHQKYIKSIRAYPGPISYFGKSYTYAQLSEIIAKQLNVKTSLFEIVPFITKKHQQDDVSITTSLNGTEVLNRDVFPNIKFVQDPNIAVWKMRGSSTPLNLIPNTYISHCIDFKKSFERKLRSQSSVEINSDILRSVILRNEETSNYLFKDASETLQVLNSSLQLYTKIYKLESNEFIWDLDQLLNEEYFHDYTLLRQFYQLAQGEIELGDFSVTLLEYLVLDKEFRPIIEEKIENPLLFNILTRILKDQAKYQFPEFSDYYQTQLGIKSLDLTKTEGVSEKLNKWQNYIKYPIKELTTDLTSSKPTREVNEALLPIITQLYAYQPKLPAPFTYKILIRSPPQYSISSNLELINKIAKDVTGYEALVNGFKPEVGRLFLEPKLYSDEATLIQPALHVWEFKEPDAWVSRLKPLSFLEENPELVQEGEADVEKFKEVFTDYMIKDLRDNISVVIREDALLKEHEILIKLNKLEAYVHYFTKFIDSSFISKFRDIYEKFEVAVEGMPEIEDVDAKVNEFKDIV